MTSLALTPGVVASPSREDQASSLRRLVEALGGSAGTRAPEGCLQPVREAPAPEAKPKPHASIIAIASGKGGVGKTSIAVNMCVALARSGVRATLLDGDLGLANADLLCGLTPRGDLGDVVAGRRKVEEIAVRAPGGFTLAPGAAGVASMADLGVDGCARLLSAMERLAEEADALIIDCGAGVGRGVLSLFGAADLGLIVTTPEPTAVADAYALLKCMRARLGAGGGSLRLGMRLIVNQARDEREARAVGARVSAVAERFLGAPLAMAGWAPADDAVSRAVRARRPLLIEHPRSRAAMNIAALAESVRKEIGLEARGRAAGLSRPTVLSALLARAKRAPAPA